MNWRRFFIIIITINIIVSALLALNSFNSSYNKYLAGEYYFRWYATLKGSGDGVYAADQNGDGICEYQREEDFGDTLYYIHVNELNIGPEESPYFYGIRMYSKSEYYDRLKNISGFEILDGALSDLTMKAFIKDINAFILLVVIDGIFFFCMFFFRKYEVMVKGFGAVILLLNLGWNFFLAFLGGL